jgi:hypothetical protein
VSSSKEGIKIEQTTPLIIASGIKISGLGKINPIIPPKNAVMKKLRRLNFIRVRG